MDLSTAVSDEYEVPFKFTGTIESITVDTKPVSATDKQETSRVEAEGTIKKTLSD